MAHTNHGGADAIMSSLAEMLIAGGEKNAPSMNKNKQAGFGSFTFFKQDDELNISGLLNVLRRCSGYSRATSCHDYKSSRAVRSGLD